MSLYPTCLPALEDIQFPVAAVEGQIFFGPDDLTFRCIDNQWIPWPLTLTEELTYTFLHLID
jgi:hypothetical protein